MSKENTKIEEVPVACNPDAIPADQRDHWMTVGMTVYRLVEEVRELPDGYACKLPGDAASVVRTAEYVSMDRQCCSFLRWTMVVEPNAGPLWLHLTGGEGVKEYLRSSFETTTMLREEVARAAGFDLAGRAEWTHPSDPSISSANVHFEQA